MRAVRTCEEQRAYFDPFVSFGCAIRSQWLTARRATGC